LAKRPKFSRWRRLPTAYWITERRPPDPKTELQRLTLYLPAGVLDQAEALTTRAGVETVQTYCEQLLIAAIEYERARERLEQTEARRGPLEGLDAIANDPEYLAEWTASASKEKSTSEDGEAVPKALDAPGESRHLAVEVVLRHAGLAGDDRLAFLPSLRRGEPASAEGARELLQALIDLEAHHRDSKSIDRRLAYALHRLAFEGQVLVTDTWAGSQADPATVDLLRIVQEGVDRVLSGEDIRYYPERS
jgi:hypothetical protein